MIDLLLHFAAVFAGYVAGCWVTRGQERQRAADLVAELTKGWEEHAFELLKTIEGLEKVAEERKRMLEELT